MSRTTNMYIKKVSMCKLFSMKCYPTLACVDYFTDKSCIYEEPLYHVDYTQTVTCPHCKKALFIPINLKKKRRGEKVKVIFTCIFCLKRIETVI